MSGILGYGSSALSWVGAGLDLKKISDSIIPQPIAPEGKWAADGWCATMRIATLLLQPEGTRISFQEPKVILTQPGFVQSIQRTPLQFLGYRVKNGESRYDLIKLKGIAQDSIRIRPPNPLPKGIVIKDRSIIDILKADGDKHPGDATKFDSRQRNYLFALEALRKLALFYGSKQEELEKEGENENQILDYIKESYVIYLHALQGESAPFTLLRAGQAYQTIGLADDEHRIDVCLSAGVLRSCENPKRENLLKQVETIIDLNELDYLRLLPSMSAAKYEDLTPSATDTPPNTARNSSSAPARTPSSNVASNVANNGSSTDARTLSDSDDEAERNIPTKIVPKKSKNRG